MDDKNHLNKPTYCNPLPLPVYPRGRPCRTHPELPDYRETADPTVLYENGVWYLYPSCGMAYVSSDFVHWEHVKIEPEDMGYAPTVVHYKDKYYMAASGVSELREADNPLGPFVPVGNFTDLSGKELCPGDPMLFADNDGHPYLYYGGGTPIYGAELDGDHPWQLITEPKALFAYNPEHVWERLGQWNEDKSFSYIEGAWMFKHSGIYYLCYCAPGTEFDTYSVGVYRGSSPLGDFVYQENNPIITKRYGIIRGPGHGCVVNGPDDTIWIFYTCTLCYAHGTERRIGMDPVGIDENGNLFTAGASEIPQFAPGVLHNPQNGNDAGMLPLSFRRQCEASSNAPGRDALYAFDDSMLTWWQPSAEDQRPWISVKFRTPLEIRAFRILWRDVGLDYRKGILPGPFCYTVEAKLPDGDWQMLFDMSENKQDLLIDYRILPKAVLVKEGRLVIHGSPAGITPGVISFTVFGECP